jgi:hypothetical protein
MDVIQEIERTFLQMEQNERIEFGRSQPEHCPEPFGSAALSKQRTDKATATATATTTRANETSGTQEAPPRRSCVPRGPVFWTKKMFAGFSLQTT